MSPLIRAITSHLVTLLAGVNFELLDNASVGKRVKQAEKKKEFREKKVLLFLKKKCLSHWVRFYILILCLVKTSFGLFANRVHTIIENVPSSLGNYRQGRIG